MIAMYARRHTKELSNLFDSKTSIYLAVLEQLCHPVNGCSYIHSVHRRGQVPDNIEYALPGFAGNNALVDLHTKGFL